MTGRHTSGKDAYSLLSTYGIPVPQDGLARTEDEAASLAQKIGYPVVLKIESPDILHKSEVAGVLIGVRDEEGVRQGYAELIKRARDRRPDAEITGVRIEEEVAPGLEILIGGATDPAFGKTITFGLGGKLVELLRDTSIRILPIDKEEIHSMIRGIQGYRLIAGFRDEPPRDEEALVNAIAAAAALFLDHPGFTEFDINPLILYEEGCIAVDARFIAGEVQKEEEGSLRPLDPAILKPRSIAVVGASPDQGKIGYTIMRNLLSFPGSLYPVNPKHSSILGRKAYPRVTDIPGTLDMAVIAVPARVVPSIISDCVEKGVRTAIIISFGFRESGEEGKQLEEEIVRIARKNGLRIIGPNSLGIMVPPEQINTTFSNNSANTGPFGLISQSGALITTIVDWSIAEDIGFSAVISAGNQSDISFVDYIDLLAHDEKTKVILLYIEEIREGRRFLETVARVTGEKPVVAIKAGSSQIGRAAAASHTGSLAGDYQTYRAAFRQAGVVPADSIRSVFQIGGILSGQGYPLGNRSVVVTSAGGFAVLSSDYAERNGIDLIPLPERVHAEMDTILPPGWSGRNPIDMIGDSTAGRFARVFDILLENQEFWDTAIIISAPTAIADPKQLALEIVRFSKHTQNVVLAAFPGGDSVKPGFPVLRKGSVPVFSEVEDLFRSLGEILLAIKQT
ncbi:MAG: Acyl-CoA synthetase (NDP forming) [Methanocalculus sp. 52_23]|jgi:acetyl coenzyme A synthetase (ADP forming)-like protein|uniref:acetate--CoA ligase family protein n=1 Tax=Methanocalculus sp. TaxID=2004547 RepID=UPI0007490C77|nr:acetate--CoA ligase family protein [Methanocalculus sp.]KUK71031.1 MAG: Acyl-CoA synthetase (NDP forming) [Methanocalculus sp. 52_23]HIJ06627.1 CoA-binding protein [Methanocalculus sp.]